MMRSSFSVSLQLYSLREQSQHDFIAVLKKVAQIGYEGVEFAGLYDQAPHLIRKVLDDLGLAATSAHGPLPSEENISRIIDMANILGCTSYISMLGESEFSNQEACNRSIDTLRKTADLMKPTGLTLGYHNHWWEFDRTFKGRMPYQMIHKDIPEIFFQIDTYWVAVAGLKPADILAELGKRIISLHIKDGPLTKKDSMTAVGSGKMQWNPIFEAALGTNARVLIVELDRCDTDMDTAVDQSLKYLKKQEFGKS